MMTPRHMRAAILVEQKKPLVIDDVELPQTLAMGRSWSRSFTVVSVAHRSARLTASRERINTCHICWVMKAPAKSLTLEQELNLSSPAILSFCIG